MTGKPHPQTDDDWTTHALNIHGDFFQSWCENELRNNPLWRVVQAECPVEYSRVGGQYETAQSRLDIWVREEYANAQCSYVIECKKHNLELVDWVFFPKFSEGTSSRIV